MAKKTKTEKLLPVPSTWGEFLVQNLKSLPGTLLWSAACIVLIQIMSYLRAILGWYVFGYAG